MVVVVVVVAVIVAIRTETVYHEIVPQGLELQVLDLVVSVEVEPVIGGIMRMY